MNTPNLRRRQEFVERHDWQRANMAASYDRITTFYGDLAPRRIIEMQDFCDHYPKNGKWWLDLFE